MARAARKHFSREFKLAALSRVQDGVRSMSEVARELGVHPGTVRYWKKQLRGLARSPRAEDVPAAGAAAARTAALPGAQESLEAEVLRLRRDNAQLRQERDILKKAAAFFARDVP
jgi:transposase